MDDKQHEPLPEEEIHVPSNAFEHFYEHFRKVPLKYIDIFIGLCVAALALVIVLGLLDSRGVC